MLQFEIVQKDRVDRIHLDYWSGAGNSALIPGLRPL
jgi:hypothetical protein